MAILLAQNSKIKTYLYAHHSFGRYIYSVDTVISDPVVSKIHMTIEWHNNQWLLRDLSRNGTWLNNRKLNTDQLIALKLGDCISITHDGKNNYTVENLSAPCDLLIPISSTDKSKAIELKLYHLLPCDESPTVAIIFDKIESCWYVEYLNSDSFLSSHKLEDNGYIDINGQRWQLKLSHLENETQIYNTQEYTVDDLELTFDISLDEETTYLKLTSPKGIIDFKTYIHHYLTLHLARCKVKDIKTEINTDLLGWVNTESLCKDLGVDIYHLNIQIHRIRKQFYDLLSDLVISENIIERRKKHVRFTGSAFQVYKGKQLEFSINNNLIL